MGETFGRYELIRKLAAGGMGEVFLARQQGPAGFEMRVVIKKILRQFSSDPKFVERFIDEGKTLVSLTHGNIVPIFDLGVIDGEYFLAMEYVDGGDLRGLIRFLSERGEALPWHLAVVLVSSVAQALTFAHNRRDEDGRSLEIVHRDISPSNILFSREGDVKLADFGIARSTRSLEQTISGFIEGKVYYMSPEQARGESLDRRTDVFSLGVVFYELLTGVRPFDGENELQILERIKSASPDAPRERLSDMPQALSDLVMGCLEKDVDKRFGDASEIVEALQKVLINEARVTGQTALADYLRESGFYDEAPEAPEKKLSFDDFLALELADEKQSRSIGGSFGGKQQTRTLARRDLGKRYLFFVLLFAAVVVAVAFSPLVSVIPDGIPTGGGGSGSAPSAPGAASKEDRVKPATRGGFGLTARRGRRDLEGRVGEDAPSRLSLTLRGASPAARVFVRGELVSVSPEGLIELLTRGPVALRVETPGRPDFETQVSPEKGLQQEIRLPSLAVANLASVRVESLPPGAQVLDTAGKPLGRTPLVLPTRGRSRDVILKIKGYAEGRATVSHRGSAVVKVVLKEQAEGRLVFRFFPANAEVRIDGRTMHDLKSNVVDLALGTGKHHLVLVGADGSPISERRFDVKAGETTNLGTLKEDS